MTDMNNNNDINDTAAWIRQAAPGGQLASDSRRIAAGDVFFAYPNDSAGDGRQYIEQAIGQGAAAIVYDPAGFTWPPEWQVPHRPVADLRRHAGFIAHAFYGMPDSGMFTVGITGTNGKTSSAVWLGSALARAGETAAVIGTLGVGLFAGQGSGRADGGSAPEFTSTGYTTPDQVLLARTLEECRAAGTQAVAIEVSSIGLEQGRVAGMHFDVALFTNLTRDHLDFHGTMAAYEAAKQKLFAWPGLKAAVINLDDPAGLRIAAAVQGAQVIGYTLQDEAATAGAPASVATLRASQVKSRSAGTEFHLDSPFGSAQVKTQLVGAFNVSNALGVLGVLLAKGMPLRGAVDAIEALTPAPGRMQLVGGNEAPMVVIDYAHTPDALEKTLEALRAVAADRGGALWCVFGCGGDRDPGKRPQMGRIAQAADQVIVTSDNPRSEDPHTIIAQIVAGMDASRPAQAIEDRAAAILSAVKHAAKNDVILVAGKGHEPYQEIKGKKLPFSDADHAQLALTARLTMMRPN